METSPQNSLNPSATTFQPSTARLPEVCYGPLHAINDESNTSTGNKTIITTHIYGGYKQWCCEECASRAERYGKVRRRFAKRREQGKSRPQDHAFLYNGITGKKLWDEELSQDFKDIADTIETIKFFEEPSSEKAQKAPATLGSSVASSNSQREEFGADTTHVVNYIEELLKS